MLQDHAHQKFKWWSKIARRPSFWAPTFCWGPALQTAPLQGARVRRPCLSLPVRSNTRERPSPSGRSALQALGPSAQSSCCGAEGEPPGSQSHSATLVRTAGERPVLRPRPPPAPFRGPAPTPGPSPALIAGAAQPGPGRSRAGQNSRGSLTMRVKPPGYPPTDREALFRMEAAER
ncbi:hypothetical protein NDU88_000868 [Pleurodeles waltl]|uniref:Uncharacterized protein n=1 Tax=Pleurodeles waltl TaxID=8319 RepID=A0AAV7S6F3_PLEWA|nr:hypothetical protein NDU88_000868 [Pleurodeles waltl]